MLSETIPSGGRLRLHREGVEGLATDIKWSGHDLDTLVERVGEFLVVSQSSKYGPLVSNPHFDANDLPPWVGNWSPHVEATWSSWSPKTNLGYGSPSYASGMHNWHNVLLIGTTFYYFIGEPSFGGIATNSNQYSLGLVETTRQRYALEAASAQFGLGPEEILSRRTSLVYGSIDEIVAALNSMGEHRIAARLEYLASDELLEDGDIPVGLGVCAGFWDFYSKFTSNAYLNLTCARGWLCTEWDFPDGSSIVLWFYDRDSARVTVFDGGGKIVDMNAGEQVRDRRTIMNNLRQAGYFSWRNTHSTDVNSRPLTISPAIFPSQSSATTDDHLPLRS